MSSTRDDRDLRGDGVRRPDETRDLAHRDSMSLLSAVAADALDPGYAEAAAGRAGRRHPASTRSGLVAALLLLGLLLAVAAAQVRRAEPAAARDRERLAAEVESRSAAADRLEQQVSVLRAQVDRAREEGLSAVAGGEAASARLSVLEAAAGVRTAAGSGVEVTLDDADTGSAAAGSGSSSSAELGRVLDRDVQAVVNGLWAAGATAVAVGDQRITSLTAIRTAGEAILVDYRPLSPPYRVRAVGPDPSRLRAAFEDGAAGRELRTIHDAYGVRYSVQEESDMTLPADSSVALRRAVPQPSAGAGPSATPTPSRRSR